MPIGLKSCLLLFFCANFFKNTCYRYHTCPNNFPLILFGFVISSLNVSTNFFKKDTICLQTLSMLQLCHDRGYLVIQDELDETLEEFKEAYKLDGY